MVHAARPSKIFFVCTCVWSTPTSQPQRARMRRELHRPEYRKSVPTWSTQLGSHRQAFVSMCVCVQGHVFKGRRHHPASSACVALPAAARSIALLARFLAPVPSRGVLCPSVSAIRGGVLTANASRGSDSMSGDRTMALLATLLAMPASSTSAPLTCTVIMYEYAVQLYTGHQ